VESGRNDEIFYYSILCEDIGYKNIQKIIYSRPSTPPFNGLPWEGSSFSLLLFCLPVLSVIRVHQWKTIP